MQIDLKGDEIQILYTIPKPKNHASGSFRFQSTFLTAYSFKCLNIWLNCSLFKPFKYFYDFNLPKSGHMAIYGENNNPGGSNLNVEIKNIW